MSIAIMSEVWKLDYLNSKEKMVLLALADSANDDGICWPKNLTLQKKCSLSTNPLSQSLKILKDVGLISFKRRSHVIEGAKSNLYQINYSDFHTGRKSEQIRLSREKFKRKSSSYSHGAKNSNSKLFKPDISTRVETNHKHLYQRREVSSVSPICKINSEFDLNSECLEIVTELDKRLGITS